jgi:hypothetical protein
VSTSCGLIHVNCKGPRYDLPCAGLELRRAQVDLFRRFIHSHGFGAGLGRQRLDHLITIRGFLVDGRCGSVVMTLPEAASSTLKPLFVPQPVKIRPRSVSIATPVGPPPRSMVFTSSSELISMTQVLLLSPLKTKTFLENGSR